MDKIALLKEKIIELQEIAQGSYLGVTYGESSHRFVLNPPITEQEITTIEKNYDVILPEDYRNFLLHIGNGGMGPEHGMYSLQKSFEPVTKEFISSAFPHTKAWYPEDPDPILSALDIDPDIFNTLVDFVQGSLLLSNCGCGEYRRLVVLGAERGNIWGDDGNVSSIFPLLTDTDPPKHLDFFAWYNDWLNEVLASLGVFYDS